MRAKSLKSSLILRAHMPYFCRPGHICEFNLLVYITKYPSGLTYVQIRHRLPTSQVERKYASYGNDIQ